MNTNSIADWALVYLEAKHSRVYRNKAPQKPVFPYVVYRIDSGTDTYPSEDMYLNVDIYEDVNVSVRAIEDLADSFDTGLNHTVANTPDFNIHFEREQRQYITPEELVSAHMINLRYVMRVYFKN